MDTQAPTVFVIDDDAAITSAVGGVVRVMELNYQHYASADAFLAAYDPQQVGCLVLDVKLPGMSGLDLQSAMSERGYRIPTIMISGHASVPVVVDSMKQGAVTFLEKPIHLEELCREIEAAIALDRERRVQEQRATAARERVAELTAKELAVLQAVARGLTNRQMAEELGISIRAVEDRRARMTKKLGVSNLASLIEIARLVE